VIMAVIVLSFMTSLTASVSRVTSMKTRLLCGRLAVEVTVK
jgi:hypothetical protein